jgi:phosphoenolpyruvate carboxylase
MNRSDTFPKIMCTQNPDSVLRYIPIQENVHEAFEAALKYECEEYIPDHGNDVNCRSKLYSREFLNTQAITKLIHPMTTAFAKEQCPEYENN